MAKELFNKAWQYLGQDGRSDDDDAEMVAAAFGSRFHWRRVGEPRNFMLSDWQVSRVLAVLGDADGARRYGEASLRWAVEDRLGPFYEGFAHEALARAAAAAGADDRRSNHLAEARRLATLVEDEDDRKVLEADLETV